jgi:hypothetical protein
MFSTVVLVAGNVPLSLPLYHEAMVQCRCDRMACKGNCSCTDRQYNLLAACCCCYCYCCTAAAVLLLLYCCYCCCCYCLQDPDFPSLSGARVVRIAVHPQLSGAGYGSRALEQLKRFFQVRPYSGAHGLAHLQTQPLSQRCLCCRPTGCQTPLGVHDSCAAVPAVAVPLR